MAGCSGCTPGDNPVLNAVGYRTLSMHDPIIFLLAAGNGYNVGDRITIAGGLIEPGGNASVFNVDSVSSPNGPITAVSIFDAGEYRTDPGAVVTQDSVTPSGGSGVQVVVSWDRSATFTPDQSTFIIGESLTREWNTSWSVNFPASPCPSPSNLTHQFNRNGAGFENTGVISNEKGCMASAVTISAVIATQYYQFLFFTRVGRYILRTVHTCGQGSNERLIVVQKRAANRRIITVD